MSTLPIIDKSEYLNICNIIKNRFEKHKQLFTVNKQMIFKILYDNSEHLSVDEIILIAKK